MSKVWVGLIIVENALSVSRGPGLLLGQPVLSSPSLSYSVPSRQPVAEAKLDAAVLGTSATCAGTSNRHSR